MQRDTKQNAAGDHAARRDGDAALQSLGASSRHIGVQAHEGPCIVDGNGGCRHLVGAQQIVGTASGGGEPSHGSPQVSPRLPRHPVGVPALDDQRLVALHGLVQRRQHTGRGARHGAMGGRRGRARHLGHQSGLLRHHNSRALFGQGLSQMRR